MRRSQTGLGPAREQANARARRRKPGMELLEQRALMAAAVTEFPIPSPASQPFGIVAGPDGNLWFTESATNNIASINPVTGTVTEHAIPTPSSNPIQITAGPAGTNTLYFTENATGKIGVIDVTNGNISEFPITPLNGIGNPAPFGVTLGADGNIWFTDQNVSNQAIGRFNVATNTTTEFPIPTASPGVAGITSGPDGNIWFTEQSANKIGQLNPNDAVPTITDTAVPTPGAAPFAITTGPDGNLWFTEESADQIGAVIPTGPVINEYAVPTPGATPFGITPGPDGNLWFTEQSANQLGRISPSNGAVEEFAVPTANAGLNLITSGPDSALWFAEGAVSQIGRFSPAQIIQATGTSVTGNAGNAFTGVVAHFTSAATNPQASDFSATIDWGDGTTSPATGIAPSNLGMGFDVAGTHTYSAEGTYTITVMIKDSFGDAAGTTSTATISGPVVPPITGPIPMVTGLVRTGIHRQPTQITLTFSTALNPLQADNALNYSIIGLGPDNMIDTVGQVVAGHANDTYIHVLTAVYNPANNTVVLTTYEHLSLKQLYQITVHSGPPVATANGLTPDGLQSTGGVYLAGVNNTPGTDYVATFQGGVIPVRTVRLRPVRGHTPALRHHRRG